MQLSSDSIARGRPQRPPDPQLDDTFPRCPQTLDRPWQHRKTRQHPKSDADWQTLQRTESETSYLHRKLRRRLPYLFSFRNSIPQLHNLRKSSHGGPSLSTRRQADSGQTHMGVSWLWTSIASLAADLCNHKQRRKPNNPHAFCKPATQIPDQSSPASSRNPEGQRRTTQKSPPQRSESHATTANSST